MSQARAIIEAESPKKALRQRRGLPRNYVQLDVRLKGKAAFEPRVFLPVRWEPDRVYCGGSSLAGFSLDRTPMFGIQQHVWDFIIEVIEYNIMEGGGDDMEDHDFDRDGEEDPEEYRNSPDSLTYGVSAIRYKFVGGYYKSQEAADEYFLSLRGESEDPKKALRRGRMKLPTDPIERAVFQNGFRVEDDPIHKGQQIWVKEKSPHSRLVVRGLKRPDSGTNWWLSIYDPSSYIHRIEPLTTLFIHGPDHFARLMEIYRR